MLSHCAAAATPTGRPSMRHCTKLLCRKGLAGVAHEFPEAYVVLLVPKLRIDDFLWECNAKAIQLARNDGARVPIVVDVLDRPAIHADVWQGVPLEACGCDYLGAVLGGRAGILLVCVDAL